MKHCAESRLHTTLLPAHMLWLICKKVVSGAQVPSQGQPVFMKEEKLSNLAS